MVAEQAAVKPVAAKPARIVRFKPEPATVAEVQGILPARKETASIVLVTPSVVASYCWMLHGTAFAS